MNFSSSSTPGDRRRMIRRIKEVAVIILVLGLYGVYREPSIKRLMDKAVDPAVAGITLTYGKVTTFVYRISGLNFGFVSIAPDPEFLFSVQLATYINQRQAAPLLNLASDNRLPVEKRERALRALLKFESTTDWIQAFLNELPKGGLLGLYEPESPLLDELVKKIRAEGGARPELVRAYAEVVFGFMLQVPDAVVRQHALNWVSDVISEDAIFLLIPRLERETDPKVRESIDQALLNIRAVSEPQTAVNLLLPYYQKPSWPSSRTPLAVVLARLGYDSAVDYLHFVIKTQNVSKEQMVTLRVATAQTPYPTVVKVSEKERMQLVRNEKRRDDQRQKSWEKYHEIARQERVKQIMLARAPSESGGSSVAGKSVSGNAAGSSAVSQSAGKQERAETSQEEASAPEEKQAEKKLSETTSMALPVKKGESAVKKETLETSPAGTENKSIKTTTLSSEASQASASKKTGSETSEKAPPKQFFPVPGGGSVESQQAAGELAPVSQKESAETSETAQNQQYASLPPEANLPEDAFPPPEEMAKPPKSLMNYVDIVFEVKDKKAVLYQNPGSEEATGVVLTEGSKGKADLEVLIGEDKWYQVKTKEGNGWTKGASLAVFNLSPASAVPTEPKKTGTSSTEKSMEGDREESTYFEASAAEVPIYLKPGSKSKRVGALTEDVAYKAVKSEKSGEERWFLLQIRSGETAWVRGQDLRLANVQQPPKYDFSKPGEKLEDSKSAFAAEWVVAGVKGVGVYSRPSIAGQMILQINPPSKYKVLELSAGGGNEWYRIQLPGAKDGWVQSLDVNLTKPN